MAKAKKTATASQMAPEAKTDSARKKAPVAKTAKPTPKAAVAAPTKKTSEVRGSKSGGLEKKYFREGSVCSVTFVLPKDAAPDAGSVVILGDFNNWSPDTHPLSRREEGDFVITLELEAGRAYRFRYMIDGWKYENDWFADRYEPNPYGGEDSVVDV